MSVALQDLLQKIHDKRLSFTLSSRGGGITVLFGDRCILLDEARLETFDQAKDWLSGQLAKHGNQQGATHGA